MPSDAQPIDPEAVEAAPPPNPPPVEPALEPEGAAAEPPPADVAATTATATAAAAEPSKPAVKIAADPKKRPSTAGPASTAAPDAAPAAWATATVTAWRSPRTKSRLTKGEQALLTAKGKAFGSTSSNRPKSAPAPGPGPGNYDPTRADKPRSPGWSFGGSQKAATGAAQQPWAPLSKPTKVSEPGPGHHDVKRVDTHSPPAWSFGKSTARSSNLNAPPASPGPGNYDPKIEKHRSPAYQMGARPKPSIFPAEGSENLFSSTTIVAGERADKKPKPGDADGGGGAAGAGAAAAADGSTAVATKAPTTGSAGFKANLDGAVNVDWSALSAKLPAGKDAPATAKRKAMWKRADPNGNGYLSLAEVDLLVRESVGEAMFSAKPAIAAAFHAARKSGSTKQQGRAADYVEKGEFRALMVMLRQYYELYAMFNRLDTSDDRRIDLGEFKQGVEMVASWGVKLAEGQVEEEFDKIDSDDGGKILFDEFAKWALAKALDLTEDDDFDGAEAAEHQAIGYMEERELRLGKAASGYITREPQPKLCYTHMGAVVPVQTTARAQPSRSPFSPFSMSRAKASPVFLAPGRGGSGKGSKVIVGGYPMRNLPDGGIAGLPYAFGQLLLEKAKDDLDAWKKTSKDDRLYGSATLEAPKPDGAAGSSTALAKTEGGKMKSPKAAGSGKKATAKVAPA